MSFLNPIWLWGLGALTIPISIHLLSRKEGKTIRIGSLRFLSETSTSKFSSIRLNEVALLALRSALIILIVLFLADLLINLNTKTSRKWVLVEQSLENEPHIIRIIDSLKNNEFEIRRYAEGFPEINSDSTTEIPDYYKLSESLGKESNLQAIVFARNSLSGFKGMRIPLPKNITWVTYPGSVNGNSNPSASQQTDTLYVSIVFDNEFQEDKKIIKAALNAIQTVAPKKIIISESPIQESKSGGNQDWIIWLSNQEFDTNIKTIYFKENSFDNLITQETQNKWVLSDRLTEVNAIEQHLPVQLMETLFGTEMKRKMIAHDKRTVSQALAWSGADQSQSAFAQVGIQSINKILLLFIVLLFIAERILAFYRKQ